MMVVVSDVAGGSRVRAQVALKCADLGNLAALGPVNRRWVQHLEEEYFRQASGQAGVRSQGRDRAKGLYTGFWSSCGHAG